MLVKIDKEYSIIDLPKDKLETKDHKLELKGLDVMADRRAEWKQIYFEAWRQMRDFFYCAEHEWRRLEGDARQVCRAAALCERSQ